MSAAGSAQLATGARARRDQCPDHVCVMGDRDGRQGWGVRERQSELCLLAQFGLCLGQVISVSPFAIHKLNKYETLEVCRALSK